MDDDFESFSDQDDEWLSEIETRATDLENEFFDWRQSRTREMAEARARKLAESRARERAESVYRREAAPGSARTTFRHGSRDASPEVEDEPVAPVHAAAWTASEADPPGPDVRPSPAGDRTGSRIEQGRRSVARARVSRRRKITIATAAAVALVTVLVLIVFRKGPSWPPSVATVQSEITTACQNPNVASEPGQVNFACGETTRQVLWVFALMTSNDNPNYSDPKSGRLGLEPITPTQGGEVAWSLNLHHPYNPQDPVDSLTVAARAINNIVAGATLTNAKGSPAVQPGLESSPANCNRYTSSAAVISRAGFPDVCAQPVTSPSGQAALVADIYREWLVGASVAAANNASILFENANNPGDAQVQAILKTLPAAN
jgi:hypothetical protein